MERCPACRARLANADFCPRCNVDLTLSQRAERQAQQWLQRSVRAIINGQPEQAIAAAKTANELARSPLAEALAGVADCLATRLQADTTPGSDSTTTAPHTISRSDAAQVT